MALIEREASAKSSRFAHLDVVALCGIGAALICTAPAIAVFAFAVFGQAPQAIVASDLMRDAVVTTIGLMLVAGAGAIVFGAAAAWLVTLCRFPGRDWFEWLLAIPLAAPSYVLAYSYSSLTWAGGAVDFPVTGFWGAAFVYAVGLYPYVYLAARAAFASQSVCVLEAARTLRAPPSKTFFQVALPLARPGIAAGGALALMEIAADYGAAQHFGLTTLSTAIFRAWYAHGAPQTALQISALLLGASLIFLAIERSARGRQRFSGGSTRWRTLPRFDLPPLMAAIASAFCFALVLFGAIAPLAWLARLAFIRASFDLDALLWPLLNSLTLASFGAIVTLTLAAAIAAIGSRPSRVGKVALFAAATSYAAPGAVMALGALSLIGAAREAGWVSGFGGAMAFGVLVWVYAARFAAAGAAPIDAGLSKVSRGVDAAARTLGAPPMRRLLRVDLPIAAPSAFAAALIVFVEILKELPATLILRPFNFDTLAVKAYAYASDERLLQAAAPSLLIFLAGLAPMLVLSRSIAQARAGTR